MTFACPNYDLGTDRCQRVQSNCIPGRPGCVLEGRVNLSEELEKRIRELDAKKQR